jgi:alginate O-acetyltransferase complex protein AlgI
MLFNSIPFFVFFPVVIGLYFALRGRWRLVMALLASYFFYAFARPEHLVLLLISTGVDYVVGRRLGVAEREGTRRLLLIASLTTNLGILFVFKYLEFFVNSAFAVFNIGSNYTAPDLGLVLPVGISFYTFQTLSYTIDIYRRRLEPEPNFLRFALFVAFFPQLVAGPIERASHLLPQLREEHAFDYYHVTSGLKLMAWGFFKKLVIADRLADYVNFVYNDPASFAGNGWVFIIATYFFAFQIYCDFSGYSDIAIGAARIMGIDLRDNFRTPYFSASIREFWGRWHISLSTWFRDYVYIPLGGSRGTVRRWYINAMIVFVVSGLWHGAAWTFVVWGAIHGGLYVLNIAYSRFNSLVDGTQRIHIPVWVGVLLTFHATCFAWVFFRANTFTDALFVLGQFRFLAPPSSLGLLDVGVGNLELALSFAVIGLLLTAELLQKVIDIPELLTRQPVAVRMASYTLFVFGITLLGTFGAQQQFIYFRF